MNAHRNACTVPIESLNPFELPSHFSASKCILKGNRLDFGEGVGSTLTSSSSSLCDSWCSSSSTFFLRRRIFPRLACSLPSAPPYRRHIQGKTGSKVRRVTVVSCCYCSLNLDGWMDVPVCPSVCVCTWKHMSMRVCERVTFLLWVGVPWPPAPPPAAPPFFSSSSWALREVTLALFWRRILDSLASHASFSACVEN